MKADTIDLSAIFGQPVRYLVPLYQRPYVWKQESEWAPLWEDIRAVLERQLDENPNNNAIPHFLGAVVLDQVLMPIGMVQARYVIDGQQRLTTLQLFIAAVRSLATERGLEGPIQMLGKLLFNDEFLLKQPEDRFKVVPTIFDRPAFQAAVDSDSAIPTGRMLEAFDYFRQVVADWAIADLADTEVERRFQVLSTVLWKLLVVVAIDLEERDNAQVIFETLNARGTPLLAADLIKNHLFQMATDSGKPVDELYTEFWQPLDQDWWRTEVQKGRLKRPRLDSFMNHWLSMRLGEEVVSHQLFPTFKRHVADGTESVETFLAELARYAGVYESFERRQGEGSRFGQFLYRIDVMEVTTSYPFLLWVFGPEGLADPGERALAMDAIESWLARRVILRGNTQGYTTVFISLLNALRKAAQPSARDIVEYLRGLEGERGYWPTDDQVRTAFNSSPVYTSITRARLRMILEAIEEWLRTDFAEESSVAHDLTIEHVLPQEWRTHWPLPPGGDPIVAESARDAAKQTIGNLTLVTNRLNPKMSNGPWAAKRDALRKLSVLLISSDVRDAEKWDEADIVERANRLADVALEVWPGPDDSRRWGELVPRRRPAVQQPPNESIAEPSRGRAIPFNIVALLRRRASGEMEEIAIKFTERLATREDLELRPQNSQREAWYFQVRSPRFRQVLAYVNVFGDSLRLDIRLPPDHDTGGRAKSRNGLYGISYIVANHGDAEFAEKLIDDALSQPTTTGSGPRQTWDEEQALPELHAVSSDLGELGQHVIDWARGLDGGTFTRATRVPEIKPSIRTGEDQVTLFALTNESLVFLAFSAWNAVPDLADDRLRREFAERIHEATGVTVNPARGWPRLDASILFEPSRRAAFLDAFLPIVNRLNSSGAN
jgi:hypothetical protein